MDEFTQRMEARNAMFRSDGQEHLQRFLKHAELAEEHLFDKCRDLDPVGDDKLIAAMVEAATLLRSFVLLIDNSSDEIRTKLDPIADKIHRAMAPPFQVGDKVRLRATQGEGRVLTVHEVAGRRIFFDAAGSYADAEYLELVSRETSQGDDDGN